MKNEKHLQIFCKYFNVKSEGNVDPRGDPHGELKGQNVLTKVGVKSQDIVQEFGLTDENELETIIEECRQILFQVSFILFAKFTLTVIKLVT